METMNNCFSLSYAAEIRVKDLEYLLSLNDDDLAVLVLKNKDVQTAMTYAADAIEQLLAENAKLSAERDAAVADLKKISGCKFCTLENASPYSCRDKGCVNEECGNTAWEWCGVQKEEQ